MHTITRINRNTANARKRAYNHGMETAILEGGAIPPSTGMRGERKEAFEAGFFLGLIIKGASK